MSHQPPRRPPSEEEVHRRRIVAFSALGGGFVLLILAIVLAITSSGGEDNVGGPATAQTLGATTPRKSTPARPKPKAKPAAPAARGFTPVPPTAIGAHKAPHAAVPILVYNVIRTPTDSTTNPETWVPPKEFAAQLNLLSEQQFNVVTLRQVWAAWKEGGLLPSHPIVISFDTGYHSLFSTALPLMRGHDWPGTLFLRAGQPQTDFPDAEVKQLLTEGWELGTEGSTGEDPTSLGDDELKAETAGARRRLEAQFGVKVEFFAYAQGSSDDRVQEALKSAGFLGAANREAGLATKSEPFQLKRIEVQNGDGAAGLAEKLGTAGLKLAGPAAQ